MKRIFRSSIPFLLLTAFLCGQFHLLASNKTNSIINQQKSKTGFIENKGQIIDQKNNPNPGVLYLLNTSGMNVQLKASGWSYDVYQFTSPPAPLLPERGDSNINSSLLLQEKGLRDEVQKKSSIQFHRIDFDLLNSNSNCEIIASGTSSDYLNYYTTGTNVNGATFVHSYKTVTYKNIYPDIDLEFIADTLSGFKYNFVVHPGGKLSSIRIRISDPEITLLASGALRLSTNLGEFNEEIPHSYFKVTDEETEVSSRFQKLGPRTFGFSIGREIPQDATLIIDPLPKRLWATYYGGNGGDYIGYIKIDPEGNIYMSGQTFSTNNIATTGAYQDTIGGSNDGLLIKFTSSGQRIWGTYYGGSEFDGLFGIAFDNSDHVYVSGTTSSLTNISTPGSHQPTYGGGNFDAYFVKFTSGGIRIWGTYFGGTDWDNGGSVVSDNSGNVYFMGSTFSTTNIATAGSYQDVPGGNNDGYLTKFDSSGAQLWGTYFGGSNGEEANSLSTDRNGHIVMTGSTGSPDGIATPGAFQTTRGGGIDGFVVEFDTSGNRLWGTYFGGSGTDYVWASAMAADGTIYISGQTTSTTKISTTGCLQPAIGGGIDAYLEKFSLGGARIWGTYYGGTGDDVGNALAVGDSSDVYLCGYTISVNNISTLDGFHPIFGGNNNQDAFLSKFTPNGIRIWGTYYGDTATETGKTVDVDPCGHIYIGGNTNSPDSITTPGSFQQTYGAGGSDCFLVKFYNCWMPGNASPISGLTNVCQGSHGVSYSIPAIDSAHGYHWSLPPGAAIVSGNNTNSIIVDYSLSAVSGKISVYGTNCCGNGDSTFSTITLFPVAAVNISISSTATTICAGTPVTFTTTSTNPGASPFYQWKVNGVNAGSNSTTFTYTPLNGDSIKCVLNSSIIACTINNPATSNSIGMIVNPTLPVSVTLTSVPATICAGSPITFTAHPVNGGTTPSCQWKVNGTWVGTTTGIFTYIPVNSDLVSCTLTSSETCAINNPATSIQYPVTVDSIFPVGITISASANPSCLGTTLTFTATPTHGGLTPSYQWFVNSNPVGSNSNTYSFIPVNGDLVSCTLTSSEACSTNNPASSIQYPVSVSAVFPVSVTITASGNPFCPGSPVTFTATPNNGGSNPTYQWKVNGINVGTNSSTYTYNPIPNDSVRCIVNSSISCVTGNPASSAEILMSGTLAPPVSFIACFDTITTVNAKPIRLKGGIPLNGTYSGPGVNSLTSTFNPATAGTGTKTITYTYTNAALCTGTKHISIHNLTSSIFTCGNSLTDVRDSKTYQTVQIGTQCWMSEDLNYGTQIPYTQDQRDNCIPEKYQNPSSILHPPSSFFYQWDELMQYDATPADQGLCPPGWHIPTENDWNILFSNYTSSGLAGSPLKSSGFSGFNALLSGVRDIKSNWDLYGFAGFYWSSTPYSSNKAWAHGMNEVDPSVSSYPAMRVNAFSVRCLQD